MRKISRNGLVEHGEDKSPSFSENGNGKKKTPISTLPFFSSQENSTPVCLPTFSDLRTMVSGVNKTNTSGSSTILSPDTSSRMKRGEGITGFELFAESASRGFPMITRPTTEQMQLSFSCPLPTQILTRYFDFKEDLSKGIYLMEDKESKTRYVLKRFENEQEAKILTKAQGCPNVCEIAMVCRIPNPLRRTPDEYMIMPYYSNGDVMKWMSRHKSRYREQPIEEHLILRWVLALVEGVEAIHAKQIIHRDLKPHNLFLDDQLNLKIGDFGVGTERPDPDTAVGTLGYFAPEVVSGEAYTKAADMYSVGCIIYVLLSRRLALPCSPTLLRFKGIPPCYSPKWHVWLRLLTQKDPRKRLTAKDIQKELERSLRGSSETLWNPSFFWTPTSFPSSTLSPSLSSPAMQKFERDISGESLGSESDGDTPLPSPSSASSSFSSFCHSDHFSPRSFKSPRVRSPSVISMESSGGECTVSASTSTPDLRTHSLQMQAKRRGVRAQLSLLSSLPSEDWEKETV